jgi:uncharacterized membrane protein YraQ (UPF0718 family)
MEESKMNWKEEYKNLLWIVVGFIVVYYLPVSNAIFQNAVNESFALLKWYAQEHVLLCLVPAFFIAGVISVFVSQAAVIRYFGARAKKWLAYLVASVSGTILAVCSCTVLPMFSGIHKRGAGLGPAIAFLYSGPAINILAIILTARILGFEMGVARTIGAVTFSVIIGLIMAFIYRKEERVKEEAQLTLPEVEEKRPLWQTATHFFILVAILVFANWGKPDTTDGFWYKVFANKWYITALFSVGYALSLLFILKINKIQVILSSIAVILASIIWGTNPMVPFIVAVIASTIILSFDKGEGGEWMHETWSFTKQILPLLAGGVLLSGFFLGGPVTKQGIIPNEWIVTLVGGNSLFANFFASVVAAFMYFATLTEVPIVQGLMNSGMGKGPALALLLAGPALSLPSMLVIRSVIGTQKTVVYVSLVVIMSTITGMFFGAYF